jgi:four helix bundle protein
MKENVIKDKSLAFGKRVVKLCRYLEEAKKEFILSNQIKRSGTAIGALVREAEHAESKKDFIHKMSIALKEGNETDYWLQMLVTGQYISQKEYDSIFGDCDELIRILVTILKTSKGGK